MKKYIPQIKGLPKAIVNDEFTTFQMVFLVAVVLIVASAFAVAMHLNYPTDNY